MSFQHNKYTRPIFDYLEQGKGNAFIEAVAGSGKTTTLLALLRHFYENPNRFDEHTRRSNFLFVAFSKAIQQELESKIPASQRDDFRRTVYTPAVRQLSSLGQHDNAARRVNVFQSIQQWLASNPCADDVNTLLSQACLALGFNASGNLSPDTINTQDAVSLLEKVMGDLSTMEIRTFHSLGRKILSDHLEGAGIRIELDNKKYYQMVKAFLGGRGLNKSDQSDALSAMTLLIDQVRLALIDPSDKGKVKQLALHFEVDLEKSKPSLMMRVLSWLPVLMKQGEDAARLSGLVDFTDMVYLPVHWGLKPVQAYDIVFVDEAQDLSRVTRRLVFEQAVSETGRVFFVGDPHQSIFGFAGSDVDSVAQTIKISSAASFPLSVCYRCPTSHIDLAKKIVSHIEPRVSAPVGQLELAGERDLPRLVTAGDLVLCRLTAPLVKTAIQFIGKRIPVSIKGRDIAAGLISILRKIEKRHASRGEFVYNKAPEYLKLWLDDELSYLLDQMADEAVLVSVRDKYAALVACYEGFPVKTLDALVSEIENLFDEKRGVVTLSTVHRAKGLEADRVFILQPEKMPLVWENQSDWQYQQEVNLLYVALTRSKQSLCILGEDDVWLDHVGRITPTFLKQRSVVDRVFSDDEHIDRSQPSAPVSDSEKAGSVLRRKINILSNDGSESVVEY